jgi:hypothetical protein
MAYLKTAEARIGQRGKTAFFGEPDALLPGHGIWEMIHKSFDKGGNELLKRKCREVD